MKKITDPYEKSKGLKKLWNYFLSVLETKDFKQKIEKIKRKYKIKGKKTQKLEKEFRRELQKLAKDYGLDYSTWWTTLEPYVLEDKLEAPQDTDICMLSDYENEKGLNLNEKKTYPIIIRISAYASKGNIEDFINRFFPIIKQIQQSYKNPKTKIGKYKTRTTRERDKFIFKRPDINRKKLQTLVRKKFNQRVSLKHISVIRKREKERQQ